jgi:hypothetical protein
VVEKIDAILDAEPTEDFNPEELEREFEAPADASRLGEEPVGVTRGATAPPGRPEPPGGIGGHLGAPMSN